MVRAKKQSKRISARLRYKNIKRVNEHQRKLRKNEKKNPGSRLKSKKDPGIPNMFPFKEELLNEIKDRRDRAEEQKAHAKEKRQKEFSKRRKLESMVKDAEKRTKDFDKQEQMIDDEFMKGTDKEQSAKAHFKEFKKVVDAADVVIEVLDARDPLGCRCPQLEEIVMSAGVNKRLILLLNKIDLVPRDIVEKWLKYFRNEFPTLAFKASTQNQKSKLSQTKLSIDMASQDVLNSSACTGAGTLMKLLGNYCRSKGIKTSISVGIVGFPNVGKSSVINSLKRSRSCNVGSTPGLTRSMQEVQLDKHVKLLDSPGVVMASGKSSTHIILRNTMRVERLVDPITPVEAILQRCNKQQIMEKYGVPDYSNSSEFLLALGRRFGKLKKGGIPDVLAAAKTMLQDWNNGKITFYTHPPERTDNIEHESAAVKQYWGAEFDLAAIEKEEKSDLDGLLQSMSSALVLDPSKPIEMEDASGDAEDEDDSEDDDEGSTMEDSEDEIVAKVEEPVVVMIPAKGKRNAKEKNKKSEVVKPESIADENNLQVNQQRKKQFKLKQKKLQKQFNKGEMVMEEDEDYDFNKDF